jgi:CSLREA domain-containing protein
MNEKQTSFSGPRALHLTSWLVLAAISAISAVSIFNSTATASASAGQGADPAFETTADVVTVGVSVSGIDGADSSCFCSPPDPNAAAGPSNVVELVNTAMEIIDKSGTLLSGPTSLASFFSGHGFTVHTLSDPLVLFDESVVNSSGPNGRFIIVADDFTSTNATNFLDFAISVDADATHGFTNFRQVNVGEGSFFADFVGNYMGLNSDGYFVDFNMFLTSTGNYSHPQVFTIDKASVIAGNFTTYHHDLSPAIFSVIPARMHGTALGGPEYFVSEGASIPQISVIKETNVLSNTPTDATTDLTVTSYSQPPAAPQPSGTITANNSRMLSVAWRNNFVVATHTVGTGSPITAHARWYQIDTTSTPTLTQSGEINPGSGIATYFPSIDINAAGDLGMTYMESSSSEFVSIYVTGRTSTDATGTMETGVVTRAGTANYTGSRAGDYSSTCVDPSDGTTFWSANEFINNSAAASWATGIASFSLPNTTPTFVVTTTADHDDGVCASNDCTLREAINAANAASAASTITFAANVTGSITLSLGSLNVNRSTTIIGPGARLLSVNGNASYRIFYFSGGTSAISGLTITNGAVIGPPGGAVTAAPAIFNQGTLTVNDCTISGNQARGSDFTGSGGVDGGTVEGGAIANSGTLTLNRCTLSGNSATGGRGGDNFMTSAHAGHGGTGEGGAIFNDATGTLSINNCTFNGNGAIGGAGGNGYFGGNGGDGSGGAVFNLGAMTVLAATLSGNAGTGGNGGTGNDPSKNGFPGVGIGGLGSSGGSSTVGDTISAGNNGNNGGGNDVNGTFTSNGYNLIGNASGSTGFVNGTKHDQVGASANLGSLHNNGGPTDTMALLAGSAAVNAGDPNAPAQDQRYYLRNGAPDVGAFESGGTVASASAVSQKTHGSVGLFTIPLPLSGTSGIECRSGGTTRDYQLVLTFPVAVTINGTPQAQVATGSGQIGSGGTSNGGVVTFDSTKTLVTVPLTNVTNAQRIAVTLFSVSDGVNTNNVTIPMGVLLGDVNGSARVDAADVSSVRQQTLQPITTSNFREDVNVSGRIDAADVSIVRQQTLTSLP